MNYTALRISLSALLGLAVTGCDAGPPQITLRTANADVVAYQDGDGPWQVVSGHDGSYTFPVTNERYGVIVGCKFGGTNNITPEMNVTLDYYAVSDSADHFVYSCVPSSDPAIVTVGGNVTGKQAGEQVTVDTGFGEQLLSTDSRWDSAARAGNGLVLATRLDKDLFPVGVVVQPVTYRPGTPIVVDLTHALPLTANQLALDPGASPVIASGYAAPSGVTYVISQVAPHGVFYTLPDAVRGDGLSLISAFGTADDHTLRSVERAFRTPPQRLDLPAKLVLAHPPTLTTTGAYPKITTTVPVTADALAYQLTYGGLINDHLSVGWTVTYSGAWLTDHGQTGASFTSELPDLPALAAYALPTQQLQWTVAAITGPRTRLPAIAGPEPQPAHDNDTFTISQQNGIL